jgi:WD40 repeat protein
VSHASFSPDGEQVITRSVFDSARVRAKFDPESGGKILSWWLESYRISNADTGAQGDQPPGEKTACIWNSTTGAELCRLTHDGPVCDATFSPEGARVLTTSSDHTARLWDALTGAELMRVVHDGPVIAAGFSSDGACVATVCDDAARIWNTFSGTERSRLKLDSAGNCAAFSPDGSCVVTGARSANPNGRDTTVELWEVASGTERFSNIGHAYNKGVDCSVFSPDGTRVLTVCDGKAHISEHGDVRRNVAKVCG